MKAKAFLEEIAEIGDVEVCENLAIARIYGNDMIKDELLALHEAIEKKDSFTVSDTGDQHSIIIKNNLNKMIILLPGIIVEGQTQNRVVQYPMIVNANSSGIKVPVNCSEHRQPINSRANFTKSSSMMKASSRTGQINQSRTWDGSVSCSAISSTPSSTEDYVQNAAGIDVAEYTRLFGSPRYGQLGYIAAIKHKETLFFYLDMLGSRNLYKKFATRLENSIAVTAKEMQNGGINIRKDAFIDFLNQSYEINMLVLRLNGEHLGEIYIGKALDGENATNATGLIYGKPVQFSLRRDYESANINPVLRRSPNHSIIGLKID